MIPKNMSQSISRFLEANGFRGGIDFPEDELDHYFKFTILRNPIERFISAYTMLSVFGIDGHKIDKPTLKTIIHNLLTGYYSDRHYNPQAMHLPCEMDIYLRMEKIKKDFKKLPFPLTTKLQHINPQTKKHEVKKLLDRKLINKLKQIYKEDFELYGKRCL